MAKTKIENSGYSEGG